MSHPRWPTLHRSLRILHAPPASPRVRYPSLQTVHIPRSSRPASTTLQPRLKPWSPWIARQPRLRASRPSRTGRSVSDKGSKPSLNPTPHLGSPPSLTQRLKKLSREYGWSAVGVYFLLSALDYPFCFLAVRQLGTDRIGHWEHVVVESIKDIVFMPFPNLRKSAPEEAAEGTADGKITDSPVSPTHGEEGFSDMDDASKKGDASLWTQLVLAYAVHKSFIFIRVPLTAAVLPKVVRTLRGWGWDIGKRRPKSK